MGLIDRFRDHGDECICPSCRINNYVTQGGEPPLPSWMEPDLCIRCQDFPKMRGESLCGHCHWAVVAEVENGIHELQRFVDRYIGWSVFQAVNGLVA